MTKRSVLLLMSRLFDPLEWLAPAVVRAKILFQVTWLKGLDWDTPLTGQDEKKWLEFQADLPRLEEIQVPRYLLSSSTDTTVQICGFGDASERAYAAVIYMLTGSSNEGRVARLVLVKTKVAPLKQMTLPRLELCAAALLTRLAAHGGGGPYAGTFSPPVSARRHAECGSEFCRRSILRLRLKG